jgi:hypothetical protein
MPFNSLLNERYLSHLDALISGPGERVIFVSPSVLADIRSLRKRFGIFD